MYPSRFRRANTGLERWFRTEPCADCLTGRARDSKMSIAFGTVGTFSIERVSALMRVDVSLARLQPKSSGSSRRPRPRGCRLDGSSSSLSERSNRDMANAKKVRDLRDLRDTPTRVSLLFLSQALIKELNAMCSSSKCAGWQAQS